MRQRTTQKQLDEGFRLKTSEHFLFTLLKFCFVLWYFNCPWIQPRSQFDHWFSHDVTKLQTSKLLILLKCYFHDE